MLSVKGRKPAALVVEPVARWFLRMGFKPNQITIASAALSVGAVLWLVPTGHLVAAAVLAGLFTAFDMIDGTMARLRRGGTRYGATLDATCDRITDGALFSAILWWEIYVRDANQPLVAATLVVLVTSQVISYVKARGEASGFTMIGGLVERPERLILALVGLGLTGFGLPYAIDTAMWILAAGSVFTVVQRLLMAKNDPLANGRIKPPAGADNPRR